MTEQKFGTYLLEQVVARMPTANQDFSWVGRLGVTALNGRTIRNVEELRPVIPQIAEHFYAQYQTQTKAA